MTDDATKNDGAGLRRSRAADDPVVSIDAFSVLNAIPSPVFVVDADRVVRHVNIPAQAFLEYGEAALIGHSLDEFLPEDSPLFLSIDQALQEQSSLTDYDVPVETPRIGRHKVTVTIGPLSGGEGLAVVLLQEQSLASRIDNVMNTRSAARQVTGMAAMLAHEVKNPLSGIRGAAQLLEMTASEQDRELTQLICDEADRIRALVDRMEVFSDGRPIPLEPVNIHTVLERVRRVAQAGFAAHIRFQERYDPSLPPVLGNFDHLVQIFLNLVKNAAEAAPETGGEIVLSTAYQRGMRMMLPGSQSRVHVPLAVSVQDNGTGIPEDLRPDLFDPFVSSKTNGSGLGLALVAKLVGDHGGTITYDSEPRRTTFRVNLPMHVEARPSGQGARRK